MKKLTRSLAIVALVLALVEFASLAFDAGGAPHGLLVRASPYARLAAGLFFLWSAARLWRNPTLWPRTDAGRDPAHTKDTAR